MKHFKRIQSAGRVALIAFGVVFLTGAAGPVTCSEQAAQSLAALETQAASAISKIKADYANFKANLPAYQEKARAYGQIVCGLDGILNAGASQALTALNNPPPAVQSLLSKTVNYSGQVTAACAKIAASQSAPNTGSVTADAAINAWNAYNAGKSSLTSATTAAAKSGGS